MRPSKRLSWFETESLTWHWLKDQIDLIRGLPDDAIWPNALDARLKSIARNRESESPYFMPSGISAMR